MQFRAVFCAAAFVTLLAACTEDEPAVRAQPLPCADCPPDLVVDVERLGRRLQL